VGEAIVGPVLRICRALDGMPLAFELWPPPGCARSPRNRSQRGWATASGCSPARERVRRLAWLARRRRCTAAAGPVAECVGLPPDEDAAGDGHLTRGMVLSQRLAGRRGLQAQGPVAKAWSPSTSQQTFTPAQRSRRCGTRDRRRSRHPPGSGRLLLRFTHSGTDKHRRDQVSDGRGCSGGSVPSAASIQLSRSACVNPGHAGISGSCRRRSNASAIRGPRSTGEWQPAMTSAPNR